MFHVSHSFHYDVMKPKYGKDVQLIFTDTDSLMYEVKREDISQDMVERIELFDLSNFETSNPYYRPDFQRNKTKVGPMKDEAGAHGIIEFVGLRPKMYSVDAIKLIPDGTFERFEKHRAKGIQRVVAAKFTHEQYMKQYETPEENFVINRRLGTRLHNIYGIEVSHHFTTDQNFA